MSFVVAVLVCLLVSRGILYSRSLYICIVDTSAKTFCEVIVICICILKSMNAPLLNLTINYSH